MILSHNARICREKILLADGEEVIKVILKGDIWGPRDRSKIKFVKAQFSFKKKKKLEIKNLS